jgi:hypothetical protein
MRVAPSKWAGYFSAVKVATRQSWKIEPLPVARAQIPYTRAFDHAEHERIMRGLVSSAT